MQLPAERLQHHFLYGHDPLPGGVRIHHRASSSPVVSRPAAKAKRSDHLLSGAARSCTPYTAVPAFLTARSAAGQNPNVSKFQNHNRSHHANDLFHHTDL